MQDRKPMSPEEINWQREKQGLTAQEQEWQREKQGLTAQEQVWQQEKQGLTTQLTAQEQAWQREKQGLTMQEQAWQQEKQGLTTQEQEWQREKQGLTPPNLTAQEQDWQREKQGLIASNLSTQEQDWQREKQGLVTQSLTPQEQVWQREKQGLSLQEQEWQREKQGIVANGFGNAANPYSTSQISKNQSNKWRNYIIPIIGFLILLIAMLIFIIALNPFGKANNNPNAAQATSSDTDANHFNPQQATVYAATRSAETAAVSSQSSQQLFDSGKAAYDQKNWSQVIDLFGKISSSDALYPQVVPLLVDAYVNQANQLVTQNSNYNSFQQAVTFYHKAQQLNPSYPGLNDLLSKANSYSKMLSQYNNKQWQDATNALAQLYSTDPQYMDVAQLYYNCLVELGDEAASQNKLDDAVAQYKLAISLPVTDKSLATSKLAALQAKLTPTAAPTATPTAVPTATSTPLPTNTPVPVVVPTPKPRPTPTVAPCAKGGKGSNFFPFKVQQPPVLNVADAGSSTIRGTVVNRSGQPLAGAVVLISSGSYSFSNITDGNGSFARSGLGRGIWNVTVVGAPVYTVCYSVGASVKLSGQSDFTADVNFTESAP